MFALIGGAIGEAIQGLVGLVSKSIPDETVRLQVINQLMNLQNQLIQGQSKAVDNETSGSSLQRNWRPLIMLLFGIIIANNYLVAPFVHLFYTRYPILPIPSDMWDLMKLGMSGYIVGRSAEKIATVLKK